MTKFDNQFKKTWYHLFTEAGKAIGEAKYLGRNQRRYTFLRLSPNCPDHCVEALTISERQVNGVNENEVLLKVPPKKFVIDCRNPDHEPIYAVAISVIRGGEA